METKSLSTFSFNLFIFMATAFGAMCLLAFLTPRTAAKLIARIPVPYLGCSGEGYSSDAYISYCSHGPVLYGHGAAYFDTEKVQVELGNADVVILGSSRAGFAFSNDVISSYFKSQGLKYYNLFFDSAETDSFPMEVIARSGAKPKLLIINVDPFFTGKMSAVGQKVVTEGVRWEYYVHHIAQSFHKRICTGSPGFVKTLVCSEGYTVFRSRSTGNIAGVFNWPPDIKVEEFSFSRTPFDQDLTVYLDRVNAIRNDIKACTMIVAIPAIRTTTPILAEKLAAALALPNFIPDGEKFETFDQSHLTESSAKRFSRDFVKSFESQRKLCPNL